MTLLAVLGILAGMAALLWFSAFIESHQLGPVDAPPNGVDVGLLRLEG
jgi:hypothetical protein